MPAGVLLHAILVVSTLSTAQLALQLLGRVVVSEGVRQRRRQLAVVAASRASRGPSALVRSSSTSVVVVSVLVVLAVVHSLANCDSCPTPAKSEAIEYLQVGPTLGIL